MRFGRVEAFTGVVRSPGPRTRNHDNHILLSGVNDVNDIDEKVVDNNILFKDKPLNKLFR